MKTLLFFALLLLVTGRVAFAQVGFPGAARPVSEFRLWQGAAPDNRGSGPDDTPTLTPFWPAPGKATGAAMVICPGGGYAHLAAYEGRDYALWLNAQGIAGFVLKYRLGSAGYRHPAMLHDVQRAVRMVRFHAGDWRLNPALIGVMGSSAGGHLASTALTHFDGGSPGAADVIERVSSRPDLGILCYAVISMGKIAHGGSRANLLGPNPAPALLTFLSSEQQVTAQTPPCFIWHTRDDPVVRVENATEFARALARNGVPYDLHIYQRGPHGLGLGVRGYDPAKTDAAALHPWTQNLLYWLRLQHFAR